MKKVIIVGMDFSEGSINALNFAVKIANYTDSNIMLLWVDKKKNAGTVYSNAFDPRLEAKNRFEDLIEEFSPRLKSGKFLYKIRNGKVHKEIVNQAKYHDAFLIIAGSHGTSGFEEFWIGSNANRVVSSCDQPVITIRGGNDIGTDLKIIVIPIDSTNITRQKLPITALLAKYFDSEVHIIGLKTSTVKDIRFLVEKYVLQAEEYFRDNGIKYTSKLIDTDNITKETLKYAEDVNANLISIMTEQETTTANLFLGPYASQMVNHSKIPVLSICASK